MRAIPSLKIILGACAALPLLSSLALAQPAPGPDHGPDAGPGGPPPPAHRPPPPHRHWHWRNHHRVYY